MGKMLSETEALAYVEELARIEQDPDHQKATIVMGPFTAFTLIGTLQLAMRHPDFSAAQAGLIRDVIGQLRPLFAGTPGEVLLRMGDEPAFDVPRGCRYPGGPHAPECGPGAGDHAAFR